jgi:hypothetical protein
MKKRLRRLVNVSLDCLVHLLPNVLSWIARRF